MARRSIEVDDRTFRSFVVSHWATCLRVPEKKQKAILKYGVEVGWLLGRLGQVTKSSVVGALN